VGGRLKEARFLADTILAGYYQSLKVWVLCLYFMGLNVPNEQIAQELAVNSSDVQQMTTQLRDGIVKKPLVTLSNEVECDEAYVIAGHKGQPEVVKNKGRKGRRRQLKGKCGRGTLEKERPHSIGFSGGQLSSYGEGSSALDFPLIHDAQSQDPPQNNVNNINRLNFYH